MEGEDNNRMIYGKNKVYTDDCRQYQRWMHPSYYSNNQRIVHVYHNNYHNYNRQMTNQSSHYQYPTYNSYNIPLNNNNVIHQYHYDKINTQTQNITGYVSNINNNQQIVNQQCINNLYSDNVDKINDLAFLDTRKSAYKKKKKSNNLIGLLLPLTGEKRAAGNLVLNTFRYSLVSNPKDIVFKIYA